MRNNQTSDKISTKHKLPKRPSLFEVFQVKPEFQGNNLASLDAKEDNSNKNVFEPKEGDLNYVKKAVKQSGEKDGEDSGKDCLQNKDRKTSLSVTQVSTNGISPKTASKIKSHAIHSKKANHISEIKKNASGEDLRINQLIDKMSTKRKVSDRKSLSASTGSEDRSRSSTTTNYNEFAFSESFPKKIKLKSQSSNQNARDKSAKEVKEKDGDFDCDIVGSGENKLKCTVTLNDSYANLQLVKMSKKDLIEALKEQSDDNEYSLVVWKKV